jgi:sulfur-oxidizing protein SoxY
MSAAPDRSRRVVLAAGLGAALSVAWRPASALSDELAHALRGFTGGAPTREGKVHFDIAPLVENGNTVPMSVSVESAMTAASHVRAIHVFNEKNPQPDVVSFHLGPRAGRASVATRIRLADTQTVIAIAELSDGTFWSASAAVVVTLAACLEEA